MTTVPILQESHCFKPPHWTNAPYNSYTLEMGKMSRNDFEASELNPMPRPKPNPEQKPNWRY